MAKNELITCRACGASIARDAKNCPNCGAKTKKPFAKTFNGRLLKYILILYVFIALDFTLNGRALPNFNSSTSTSTNTGVSDITTETPSTDETLPTDTTNTDITNTENTETTQTAEPSTTDSTGVQTQNANTSVENSTSTEQAPTTNEDGTVAPVKIGQ